MLNFTARFFGFDETLTRAHTLSNPSAFTPEKNTKAGLDTVIKHDGKNILAVATYHNDAKYVLSYLLPLLKLDARVVSFVEQKTFTKHHMTKFYLKGEIHPIIISTVPNDKAQYRKGGKNQALNDIAKELPICSEYHFYDEDQISIEQAYELEYFTTHRVDRLDFFQVTAIQIYLISFIRALLIQELRAYKNERNSNNPFQGSSFRSFFSFYSKMDRNNAIDALIHSLMTRDDLDKKHLGPLNSGGLRKIISDWQKRTGKTIQEAIKESSCLFSLEAIGEVAFAYEKLQITTHLE